ncbi:hypothetical protein WA158_007240 [Blastocystis sp. Blastoise]
MNKHANEIYVSRNMHLRLNSSYSRCSGKGLYVQGEIQHTKAVVPDTIQRNINRSQFDDENKLVFGRYDMNDFINTPASKKRIELLKNECNIYPGHYPLLINNPHLCDSSTIQYIVYTPIRPKKFKTREIIRQTWGHNGVYHGYTIRHFFLLGEEFGFYQNSSQLIEESEKYKDIIQYGYHNSFFNCTLQTLLAMEWVTQFCPQAKLFVKTNSDVYLNHNKLIQTIDERQLLSQYKYTAGLVIQSNVPDRNYKSLYYCPSFCNSQGIFDPYIQGSFYIYSSDILPLILQKAKEVSPRTHLEDIYLSILLKQLNIQPYPNLPFVETTEHYPSLQVLYFWKSLIAIHHIDDQLQLDIHNYMNMKN